VRDERPLTRRRRHAYSKSCCALVVAASVSSAQTSFGQASFNPQIEQALRKVVAQQNTISALDAEAASRKSKIAGIAEDQQRVRENMKALKGSAEEKTLVARYVQELTEQEDRVQSLHREMSDLQQKREAAQKTLNEMIEGLQMEATL
jgi:chromosome segregation ATPase